MNINKDRPRYLSTEITGATPSRIPPYKPVGLTESPRPEAHNQPIPSTLPTARLTTARLTTARLTTARLTTARLTTRYNTRPNAQPITGRTIARMIGVTLGALVLAMSFDAFAAIVFCLTFWTAGLLLRWPIRTLNFKRYFPRYSFQSIWDMHLWTTVFLLLLIVLFQQETISSIQFWLYLAAVGYHLSQIKLFSIELLPASITCRATP